MGTTHKCECENVYYLVKKTKTKQQKKTNKEFHKKPNNNEKMLRNSISLNN